ncbi:substrate-binding domain-containing protein [Halodesulfurarchaeum sp.]|uniref:substrate-binding domain-containing protein n=1 Tax=Halodesulfurarchaeum sp. TaxID=1980530 RepID=UPI002FC2D5F9
MTDKTTQFDRRNFLKATGLVGSLALTSTAGCLGGDEEAMTLVAGTAPGFPPFEMKEGETLKGFDIDLLEAVVEETEYELSEWSEFEFGSLSPALQNEKIDVIAAAMTIRADRDENIDFTDPYYDANQAILVASESGFTPATMSDLDGANVGAQKGTTGESTVETQLIEENLVAEGDYSSYGNYVLAVEDLVNGNIDAVVLDTPVADSFVADREVQVAFTYETGEQYGFAIREGASELQSTLNDGLATVKENGTYDDIVAQWFK